MTIPICTPIVIWVFLPFYHRLRVFTAYEYLERRFNSSVRLASSLLFLLLRGSYLAVVIYAPSLVLSTVTGLELKWTIFIVGGLATLYTLLGGMKAVIWTDVVQATVLFGGLILVTVILALRVEGGVGEIVAAASDGGPFRVELGWGTWAEVTLWAVLVNGFFIHLSMYGADQMTLQRYLTTPTLRAGRNSMLLNAVMVVPAVALLLFVGGALYVFYQQFPDRLAEGLKGDAVLPHFVIHELPAGISGIFIAAMFAAAMSTIDSAINSLSTSTMKDLYQRFVWPEAEERTYLNLSRLFTVFWGGVATFFALYIGNFPNILVGIQDPGRILHRKHVGHLHVGRAHDPNHARRRLDRSRGGVHRSHLGGPVDVHELPLVRPAGQCRHTGLGIPPEPLSRLEFPSHGWRA